MNFQNLLGGIGQALSNPKFRLLWWTNTVNSTGRWQYKFAVSWFTWETTNSPALLGIVAFADTIPMVFMTLIAGAWTDRYGSMMIMRMCQSIMIAAGVLISIFALTGSLNILYIIVLSFIIGGAEAVTVPARLSIVHYLVPKNQLSSAVALSSASFNLARFVGPAMAGFFIAIFGVPVTIAIATGMFIIFYFGLLVLGSGGKIQKDGLPQTNILQDLMGGFHYVFSHAGITFLVIVLSLTALLIRPYIDLLAGVSDQVFGQDVAGFSILLSATALGALLGGLWLARRGRTEGLTNLFTWCLIVSAAAQFLLVLSPTIWIGAAMAFFTGMFVVSGSIASQALIQNSVAPEVRGRVISITAVLAWGVPAVGALAMGWIAEFLGLAMTLGLAAALSALLWIWARSAGLRHAEQLESGGNA
ncbi:MAG: MFS transporter [Rhodospirillales bacterium]|nr:MFS transporter [Rhodospirillales bacterium]